MVCRSAHRLGNKAKVEWALGKLVFISSQIFGDNFTDQLILIITRLLVIIE